MENSLINPEIWQDEYNRQFSRHCEFVRLLPSSFGPRPPWYKRQWNLFAYRFGEFRERLGEIIAGREFGDD